MIKKAPKPQKSECPPVGKIIQKTCTLLATFTPKLITKIADHIREKRLLRNLKREIVVSNANSSKKWISCICCTRQPNCKEYPIIKEIVVRTRRKRSFYYVSPIKKNHFEITAECCESFKKQNDPSFK